MEDGSSSVERVSSGKAWEDLCDMLKVAGSVILREDAPSDPLTRAEGFRYLSRIARAALEGFVEHADPLHPRLHRPVHETAKMGADNPDNYYQNAVISGRHEYRIVGTRGTVHYLGLGTYAGNYGMEGRSAKTGYLEGSDLVVEPDGTFVINLSCREQPGNWLPMEADTSSLIVRQTFLDRRKEEPARLEIERVGGAGEDVGGGGGSVEGAGRRPGPLSSEALERGFNDAGRLVVGAAALFANWVEGFASRPNELPPFDPGASLAAHGDPNIFYYHGYWALEPDEALVVEAEVPECDYWNFQLNNYWMESLDYRYFNVAINKSQAVYEQDGSLRIVVSHTDPKTANWIETAGHSFGTMCFRWVRASHHPQPRTRVVKAESLVKAGSLDT